MRAGVHGSVGDSTKEVPTVSVTNILCSKNGGSDVAKTHGQSLSANGGDEVTFKVTISVGGGVRQSRNNNDLSLSLAFTGDPAAAFMGGTLSDVFAQQEFTSGGSKTLILDGDMLTCMGPTTAHVKIAAGDLTLTDVNTGLTSTGAPSSNFIIDIAVS